MRIEERGLLVRETGIVRCASGVRTSASSGLVAGLVVAGLAALPTLEGCMPPSVRAVDEWLSGFAQGDRAKVLEWTTTKDRELVGKALDELKESATTTLALALPPKPIEHRILEIEAKETSRRHRVLVEITLRNPLPFNSERLGQSLDVPRTRSQERRFLSIEESGRWGVQLDLAATIVRAEFVSDFSKKLAAGALDEASAMLTRVPPPPDEANAMKNADRLVDTLRRDIEKARKLRDQRKEQPADHPTELPVEQPSERPAERPAGQPESPASH